MLRYVLRDTGHESFIKKYASKRFMKVISLTYCEGICLLTILLHKASRVVAEWARELYSDYEEIDLVSQVNDIKAGIRMKKKLREQGLLHDIHPLERLMRETPSLVLDDLPEIVEDHHAQAAAYIASAKTHAA